DGGGRAGWAGGERWWLGGGSFESPGYRASAYRWRGLRANILRCPDGKTSIRSSVSWPNLDFRCWEALQVIKRMSDALGAIERALTVIAVMFLFVIMMLVVADVFMRYVM